MASRLKKLQDRQAAIVSEMRGMLEAVDAEDRQLGEGVGHEKEVETYANLEKRASDILIDIGVEERLLAKEKALATIPDPAAPASEEERTEDTPKEFKLPATARRHSKLKNFKGPDAEADAYRAGMWFRAVIFGDSRAARFCGDYGIPIEKANWAVADRSESRTAQAEGVNSLGGYLVPEILERTIIDLRETYGVFRREARTIPMGSDAVNIPRRTGGLTAYFVGENTEITESNKTWDNVALVAKKVAILTKWSTELDEDAIISLADDLAKEIAYAFSEKEDRCGFIGDGTSTYGGMVGIAVKINDGTHAASIHTALAGNTGFATLDMEDFNGVVGKLPLYARANAKWYVHASGAANSMERLAYAAGGNTVQTIGGGSGPSFLGYPIVFSQVLNSTLGADVSAIKLLFGDLSMSSTMGTRRGVMIKTSTERYIELDQLAIMGTERFDINNHDLGDNTTAGPIIALKTPGS